jgi:hypothetical protein
VRRVQSMVAILATLLWAAWLIDTWTEGRARTAARSWWGRGLEQVRPRPAFATGEAVVAEAIRLTRADAEAHPRGHRGEV